MITNFNCYYFKEIFLTSFYFFEKCIHYKVICVTIYYSVCIYNKYRSVKRRKLIL